MNDEQAIELADKVRTRWRSTDLGDEEQASWSEALADVDYETARAALSKLFTSRPHCRPTLDEFHEAVHELVSPTRLSPRQIETNLRGIAHVRSILANRHTENQETA